MSRTSQAEAAAAEFRRLCRAGRYPEADQVRRTIEEMLGHYWSGWLGACSATHPPKPCIPTRGVLDADPHVARLVG